MPPHADVVPDRWGLDFDVPSDRSGQSPRDPIRAHSSFIGLLAKKIIIIMYQQ